jgi:hypothetical protein
MSKVCPRGVEEAGHDVQRRNRCSCSNTCTAEDGEPRYPENVGETMDRKRL